MLGLFIAVQDSAQDAARSGSEAVSEKSEQAKDSARDAKQAVESKGQEVCPDDCLPVYPQRHHGVLAAAVGHSAPLSQLEQDFGHHAHAIWMPSSCNAADSARAVGNNHIIHPPRAAPAAEAMRCMQVSQRGQETWEAGARKAEDISGTAQEKARWDTCSQCLCASNCFPLKLGGTC
jgi:hypothetical protein